jgi:hypothetical protein
LIGGKLDGNMCGRGHIQEGEKSFAFISLLY